MSGHASAASVDLAAQICLDIDNKQIPSQSAREAVPEIHSTSKGEPIAEIQTKSERDKDADSDDGQQRLPDGSAKMDQVIGISGEDSHVSVRSLSDVSIFKIPDSLKGIKREAYVPHRVLLGPFHHRSREIRAIDIYTESALKADFADNAIEAIRMKEDEIRNSYEESINWDGKLLAKILFMDGCLILGVLKNLYGLNEDPFWRRNVFVSKDPMDILMLENQIPWIVLIELLRSKNPKDEDVESTLLKEMMKVTCDLLKISSEDRTAPLNWLQPAATKVHHLLDFVHKVIVLRPPNQPIPTNQGEHRISSQMPADNNEALNHDVEKIPPAVQLKNAGIKFQHYNGGIRDINSYWDSSTIYLPVLFVTCDTEVLFRNLIAFEKKRQSELKYVTNYVNLMADLIDSQNDVAFLKSTGILRNPGVNDEKVAHLFKGLLEGVTVGMPDIYAELRKVVNTDYKNRCGNCKNGIRVQLAELLRDHFSSPWKALAWAVASVTLCLTIIQTIYAVKK